MHGGESACRTRPGRILGGILLAAVVIRMATVAWTRSYLIPSEADHFPFGYEAGRIARSLVSGGGFASPMPYPTGPTASVAPGYPLLLSGIFRLFGVYTVASAWAAYALNAIASALTCLVLYRLGAVIFGTGTGLLAAGMFALYPNSIWFAAGTIWDVSLLALCVPVLMLLFYLLPTNPSPGELVQTGLWMGALSLLNPAVATVGLVGLCWIWIRLRGPARYWKPGLAAVVCFLLLLPWMVRNAIVVGEFAPRSTGGLNLRRGNSEVTWEARTRFVRDTLNPADHEPEGKRFRDLGEAGYDRESQREAISFIRHNPDKFLVLTGNRILRWWIGYESTYTAHFHGVSHLDFWKRLLGSAWLPFFLAGAFLSVRRGHPVYPLLAAILIYPLPYYATLVIVRYRFPAEPLILIFAAYCLTALWDKFRARASSGIAHDNLTTTSAPANLKVCNWL